jgi:hypothetical protein
MKSRREPEKSLENKVELLGHYGGDLEHACSAWTSTSRNLSPEKLARIPKLLEMLAKARTSYSI